MKYEMGIKKPASEISTPRVKECFLSLECTFEWEKSLFENSRWTLICGRVKHLAMEEERPKAGAKGRYGSSGYFYNLHSPKNPIDGSEKPDMIGVIEALK